MRALFFKTIPYLELCVNNDRCSTISGASENHSKNLKITVYNAVVNSQL